MWIWYKSGLIAAEHSQKLKPNLNILCSYEMHRGICTMIKYNYVKQGIKIYVLIDNVMHTYVGIINLNDNKSVTSR